MIDFVLRLTSRNVAQEADKILCGSRRAKSAAILDTYFELRCAKRDGSNQTGIWVPENMILSFTEYESATSRPLIWTVEISETAPKKFAERKYELVTSQNRLKQVENCLHFSRK